MQWYIWPQSGTVRPKLCTKHISSVSSISSACSLLSPSTSLYWDSIHSVYDSIQDFLHKVPWKRRLILYFYFRGTRIKIDLGDVKSAGLLALLGIGVSLGTLLLFKLYQKIFPSSSESALKKEVENEQYYIFLEDTKKGASDDSDKTSQSGVMGNVQPTNKVPSVHYNAMYGVAIGPQPKDFVRRDTSLRQREPKVVKQREASEKTRAENLRNKSKKQIPRSLNIGASSYESGILCKDDGSGAEIDSVHDKCDYNKENSRLKSPHDFSESLLGNYSPMSLNGRNLAFSPKSDQHSVITRLDSSVDPECNKQYPETSGLGPIHNSSVFLTPPDDNRTPIATDSKPRSTLPVVSENEECSESYTDHPRLTLFSREQTPASCTDRSDLSLTDLSDVDIFSHTDSHRSSFAAADIEFDESDHLSDDSPKRKLSQLDRNFRLSVLNRVHEWATKTQDSSSESRSRSLSPETRSTPERTIHRRRITTRSRDCQSHLESPMGSVFEGYDIGLRTSKNFDDIEDEIQKILNEFQDMDSQLTDFKSRPSDVPPMVSIDLNETDTQDEGYSELNIEVNTKHLQENLRQDREHSLPLSDTSGVMTQSFAFTDTSGHMTQSGSFITSGNMSQSGSLLTSDRMSQSGSFVEPEMSWDAGDIQSAGTPFHRSRSDGQLSCVPSVWMSEDGDSIQIVAQLSSMGEAWDDREWENLAKISNSTPSSQRETTASDTPCSECERLVDSNPDEMPSIISPVQETILAPVISLNYNECIGQRVDMLQYATHEWRGDTIRSKVILEGYSEAQRCSGCACLRRVRGDNYCAIRGTLYQFLEKGLSLSHLSYSSIIEKLTLLIEENAFSIQSWTFANQLTCNKGQVLDVMTQCLQTLFNKVAACQSTHQSSLDTEYEYLSSSRRASTISGIFNGSRTLDVQLLEAVKILMFVSAVDLYKSLTDTVPMFAWLMFARDTSENPADFLLNHLNPVGDTAGLEQIEMFLLGYCLHVQIQVYRLSQYGHDDFIALYPDPADCNDEDVSQWPTLCLLAEDDRHYNIAVS